jgi:GT2 family glycosyltransferase
MTSTIAVLLTCHNRKEKTLQCLKSLYKQEGLKIDFVMEVFLVDDASTDGTEEAIKKKFPQVTVVHGDGNLYWNRGMLLAWETASKTRTFDYYLWLNDDTFLNDTALQSLINHSLTNVIVCGTTQSAVTGKATYGGRLKNKGEIVIPNGSLQKCDYFNGNCVLIPRSVFEIVGKLDPVFHHAVGDFDYSLRAKKLGVALYVAPEFIGTCESHEFVPKWQSSAIGVSNRLKHLYTPSSGCYPPQFFVFDRRHNGLFLACVHYFSIHLRAIMPFLWK